MRILLHAYLLLLIFGKLIYHGLSMVWELGYRKAVLEMDSQVIVQHIKKDYKGFLGNSTFADSVLEVLSEIKWWSVTYFS